MDAKDEAVVWAVFSCSIGRNQCRGCCMVLRLNCSAWKVMLELCFSPRNLFPSKEQGTSQGLWHTRVCLFEHPGRALLL